MSKYEKLLPSKPKDFKCLIDVKEKIFTEMIDVFRKYDQERKESLGIRGRKGLAPEDKVLLMLGCHREYQTLEYIGFDYSGEATASRVVNEIEGVLIKLGKFFC